MMGLVFPEGVAGGLARFGEAAVKLGDKTSSVNACISKEDAERGEIAQQGANAKGPGCGVRAVGHLIMQTAEQRTADTDPVTQFVGEAAAGVVAILGPVLTVLPTLVLTRKYLKV